MMNNIEPQSDYDSAVHRVEEKMRFFIHLTVYVLVNTMLTAINLLNNPQNLWFYWPLAGWGIGIVLHAWKVFSKPRLLSLKQRMIQHELEKTDEPHGDSRG